MNSCNHKVGKETNGIKKKWHKDWNNRFRSKEAIQNLKSKTYFFSEHFCCLLPYFGGFGERSDGLENITFWDMITMKKTKTRWQEQP